MANLLTVWVILGKIILVIGQAHFIEEPLVQQPNEEIPGYSFGYGVADIQTGDVKTVWEAKEGDTVKGHYSVIEPDGSKRMVEYSAGPNSGFTAPLNIDGFSSGEFTADEDKLEDKALRDYDKYYDFSEDEEMEPYKTRDKKRKRNPYESQFKDSFMKRPIYPADSEPSEYTHSFTINHPRDELEPQASAHSHVGFKLTDPNCKTKHKKQKNNLYNNDNTDFRRQKYPSLTSDYDSVYDKYHGDSSNMEKIIQRFKYNDQYMSPKPEEFDWSSTKNGYTGMSDVPTMDNVYNDYTPPRPKKKKPHKNQDPFSVEDLDDYVLVRKKKFKKPPRIMEASEYQPEIDEEFDDTYEDEHYHKPSRPTHKEVVRKIVKKKKPGINILDIFDI